MIIVPPHWRVRDQVLVLGARHAIERGAERGSGPLLSLSGFVIGGRYNLSATKAPLCAPRQSPPLHDHGSFSADSTERLP